MKGDKPGTVSRFPAGRPRQPGSRGAAESPRIKGVGGERGRGRPALTWGGGPGRRRGLRGFPPAGRGARGAQEPLYERGTAWRARPGPPAPPSPRPCAPARRPDRPAGRGERAPAHSSSPPPGAARVSNFRGTRRGELRTRSPRAEDPGGAATSGRVPSREGSVVGLGPRTLREQPGGASRREPSAGRAQGSRQAGAARAGQAPCTSPRLCAGLTRESQVRGRAHTKPRRRLQTAFPLAARTPLHPQASPSPGAPSAAPGHSSAALATGKSSSK
nr:collagen alpha-1(I) chain isoform X3 [Oryctolagus cuniculus]